LLLRQAAEEEVASSHGSLHHRNAENSAPANSHSGPTAS
jgi:hypothetical protein